jgi:type 1 fimbriae regulatory protein FimB/type 1 fimbriae regulatory protein FimE
VLFEYAQSFRERWQQKGNRHSHRDATMISVAYRHGLRAAELVDLHWDQIDFRMAL